MKKNLKILLGALCLGSCFFVACKTNKTMDVKQNGILLIVSGPSGCGKTTVCQGLVKAYSPGMQRVITATTRLPRPGEVQDIDYHFLSPELFDQKVKEGEFLEHAHVYRYAYGTLKSSVYEPLKAGHDLVLNVDVQGVASFIEAAKKDPFLAKHMATVFIYASTDTLRQRLIGRKTDSAETIERRLAEAQKELDRAPEFDFCIQSMDMDHDLNALKAIYHKLKNR